MASAQSNALRVGLGCVGAVLGVLAIGVGIHYFGAYRHDQLMLDARPAKGRITRVKANKVTVEFHTETGGHSEMAYRQTWRELPIAELLPEGGVFAVRYAATKPDLWEVVFDHQLGLVAGHLKQLRDMPAFAAPVLQVDPIRVARSGKRGYAAIHVSGAMTRYPWGDSKGFEAHLKNPSMRRGSTCGVNASLASEVVASDVSSFYFGRRPRQAPGYAGDLLFLVNEVSPGETLSLTLHCQDGRLAYRKHLRIGFTAQLSATKTTRLTPLDATPPKLADGNQ